MVWPARVMASLCGRRSAWPLPYCGRLERALFFVFICLTWTGQGRRVRRSIALAKRWKSTAAAWSVISTSGNTTHEQMSESYQEEVLAPLLNALDTTVAFNSIAGLRTAESRERVHRRTPHCDPPTTICSDDHNFVQQRSSLIHLQDIHMTDSSAEAMIRLSAGKKPASEINVAVYGGGSFGTAMACVLARKGIPVKLVVRREEVVEQINEKHVNPYYQSDLELPPLLRATTKPEEAFATADFIFHAVPMQFSRKALEKVKDLIRDDIPVVSLSKGIETSSLMFMSDLLPDVLGPDQPVAFVSGPSFAAEIVSGIATAVTVASTDRLLATDLMALFTSSSFRALYTPDVVGVEVGGAVKNVIAIAAGMSEGLGLGTNAMAALVTRGCGEMRRLVVTLGGESSTVFGLSGVGDTFGTCFGPLSRNRQVGLRLGQGEKLEDILDSMSQVAEGVATAKALTELIDARVKGYRKDLKYPILYGVAAILDGEISPREGLMLLMEKYPIRLEEFPF